MGKLYSFKIADKSEIGTFIASKESVWKDVHHVKVHLIKSKINRNNICLHIDYRFAIITCCGNTGLPKSGFNLCSIDLKMSIFFYTSKVMSN